MKVSDARHRQQKSPRGRTEAPNSTLPAVELENRTSTLHGPRRGLDRNRISAVPECTVVSNYFPGLAVEYQECQIRESLT